MKKKVLFVCTHNSARSQIAEGLLNHFCGDRYQGFSVGSAPTMVNPFAIEVLKEIGIDITDHYSKSMLEFEDFKFEYVAILLFPISIH